MCFLGLVPPKLGFRHSGDCPRTGHEVRAHSRQGNSGFLLIPNVGTFLPESCYFPAISTIPGEEEKSLHEHHQIQRKAVQFEWFNRQYSSFDDYLTHFNSRKRKNVRKERIKITTEGIKVVRLYGEGLTEKNMRFFYDCYKQTYLKRSGHDGYLTEDFFQKIFRNLHQNLMLVIALKDNTPIASALFVFDKNQLCGRYWGALEDIDNLHFECCYYQGIEFCIERNIAKFNPGTQGEHKILRGFEPIYCYSNHSLTELAFHEAVERFIDEENTQITQYKNNAEKLLPFKQTQD